MADKVGTHIMVREDSSFHMPTSPQKRATGEELFPIVWDGVRNLEESGRSPDDPRLKVCELHFI